MHSRNVLDKIIIHEVNLKERDTKMNNTIRYIYDCVGQYSPGLSAVNLSLFQEQLTKNFFRIMIGRQVWYPHVVPKNEAEEITDPAEKDDFYFMQYKLALRELARACKYVIQPNDTEEDILPNVFLRTPYYFH